jgi:hypothetical protein
MNSATSRHIARDEICNSGAVQVQYNSTPNTMCGAVKCRTCNVTPSPAVCCYWLVAELPPILRLGSLGMMERAGCNDTQSKSNHDVNTVLASETGRKQSSYKRTKTRNALQLCQINYAIISSKFDLIIVDLIIFWVRNFC